MLKPLALIIEDDKQLGQIFAKTLQTHFDAEIASDGITGIMRLAQIRPTIVVLDLNLPGMAGKDILNDIRTNPDLTHTRVILCTADTQQAELLKNEADIVLLKPVSPSQLREIAARFISA